MQFVAVVGSLCVGIAHSSVFALLLQAFVALGEVPGWWEDGAADYPMDYYSSTGGSYNSTYHRPKPRAAGGPSAAAIAAAARARAGGAAAAGIGTGSTQTVEI